jgi:hypothetical protein
MIDAFTMFALEKENYLGSREQKIEKLINEIRTAKIKKISPSYLNRLIIKYHLNFLTVQEKEFIERELNDI